MAVIRWDDPLPDDCTRVGNFLTSVLQDAPGVESIHNTHQKGLFFKTGPDDLDKIDSVFLDNNIKVCNLQAADTDGIQKGFFRRLRIKKPITIAFDKYFLIGGDAEYDDNLTDLFLDFFVSTGCYRLNRSRNASTFIWGQIVLDTVYKFWRVMEHKDIDGTITESQIMSGTVDAGTGNLIGAPDSFIGEQLDVRVLGSPTSHQRRLIQMILQVSSDGTHWPATVLIPPPVVGSVPPVDTSGGGDPCT